MQDPYSTIFSLILSHQINTPTDLAWFGPSPLSDKRAQTIPASCSLSQPIASGSALRPNLIGCASPPPCGCWRWSSCHPASKCGRWLHGADAGWSSGPLRCWCSDCPPECKQVRTEQGTRWLINPARWTSEALRRWQGVPGHWKTKPHCSSFRVLLTCSTDHVSYFYTNCRTLWAGVILFARTWGCFLEGNRDSDSTKSSSSESICWFSNLWQHLQVKENNALVVDECLCLCATKWELSFTSHFAGPQSLSISGPCSAVRV